MAWDRVILSKKDISVSDNDLDSFFNPWHRESRTYEHIDTNIKGPERLFFPKYYGTAKIPYSSCPARWRWSFPDHGDVCIVVLELLKKLRVSPGLPKLVLSKSLLTEPRKYILKSRTISMSTFLFTSMKWSMFCIKSKSFIPTLSQRASSIIL